MAVRCESCTPATRWIKSDGFEFMEVTNGEKSVKHSNRAKGFRRDGCNCPALHAATRAQTITTGAIAGTAKDTSGALLPGVTVQANSPALIEGVRTVVTDFPW